MKSIRRQLTREVLGAVLLLLAGGLAALYAAARKAAVSQFDIALEAKARAISTVTTYTDSGLRVDFTDRFLPGFEDYSPRDFFQVWTADGRELARSESLAQPGTLPRQPGTLTTPARWDFVLPNGQPGRAIGYSFRPRGLPGHPREELPEIELVVASNRSMLDNELRRLLEIGGGLGLLLASSTLVLIPSVLRRGLRPLDRLSDVASRIDAGSLGERFSTAGLPAELLPIAQRLNEALSRLEQSFERERRFSADLAHELRTPLAELRSMAECAVKWPESRDADVDRETVAIARQMEGIVSHILALSRTDQGIVEASLEPIDLAPFVERVCSDLSSRAAERRLQFSLRLEPAMGQADGTLLRSIVVNLCENAVEYAVPGSTIEVSIETEAHGVSLRIANRTRDLVETDVPKLFDRFWRKDAARSGGTHAGLGLSLARAFATTMGWTLDASLDPSRRVVFRLSGPRAAAPVSVAG